MKRHILTTTFALLHKHDACMKGYEKLAKHLGGVRKYGDRPIPLAVVLDSNGLNDTLWCLRAVEQDWLTVVRPLLRQYLADLLEHILSRAGQHEALVQTEIKLLRDPKTTEEQFREYAAVYAATYAYAAVYAAATYAYAAVYAAAAYAAAATYAVDTAVYAATYAVYAAVYAATYDAADVYRKEERAWQTERLRQYLTEEAITAWLKKSYRWLRHGLGAS